MQVLSHLSSNPESGVCDEWQASLRLVRDGAGEMTIDGRTGQL
jgi:hypothetical protein